jgi:hypothetical protein
MRDFSHHRCLAAEGRAAEAEATAGQVEPLEEARRFSASSPPHLPPRGHPQPRVSSMQPCCPACSPVSRLQPLPSLPPCVSSLRCPWLYLLWLYLLGAQLGAAAAAGAERSP